MRVLRTWGLGAGAAVALSISATVAVGQAPPAPGAAPTGAQAVTFPECTKKPTPADVEGAKGAHKAASQFYDRAEYDKAIRYWNDAYTFDCTANDLLLNIANAYEKLGDRASTVATLETYLKRTGPNTTLELKVKNLKAALAPPAPTQTPSAVPTAPPVPTATATSAPTAAPTAPPPEGPRPFGNTPLYVTGGGGLLALIGLILVPIGTSAVSSAAQACPDHVCPKNTPQSTLDQGNHGRAEVGAGAPLLTVGLLAVGGGLVWHFLFNKPKAVAAQPAAPAPAPGQPAPGALPPAAPAPASAPPPPKAGMWVGPSPVPGGGGLRLGGSF